MIGLAPDPNFFLWAEYIGIVVLTVYFGMRILGLTQHFTSAIFGFDAPSQDTISDTPQEVPVQPHLYASIVDGEGYIYREPVVSGVDPLTNTPRMTVFFMRGGKNFRDEINPDALTTDNWIDALMGKPVIWRISQNRDLLTLQQERERLLARTMTLEAELSTQTERDRERQRKEAEHHKLLKQAYSSFILSLKSGGKVDATKLGELVENTPSEAG